MSRALLFVAITAAVLIALHLLATWAERRGWMYYREGRGRNWGVSMAAQELQSLLQPFARHVVEQKQEEELLREESGNAADDAADDDAPAADEAPAIDAAAIDAAAACLPSQQRVEGGSPDAIVRPEQAGDVDAIREILIDVFSDMEHSQQTEHLIVDALRDSGALSLSLIAELDGRIVGHVAFSPATVGDELSGWFVLGPLSVARDRQGHGLARALVEQGLRQIGESGARGVVLVGDPALYERFGFRREPEVGWPGIPGQYVQVMVLHGGTPAGEISCDPAFWVEPEGTHPENREST